MELKEYTYKVEGISRTVSVPRELTADMDIDNKFLAVAVLTRLGFTIKFPATIVSMSPNGWKITDTYEEYEYTDFLEQKTIFMGKGVYREFRDLVQAWWGYKSPASSGQGEDTQEV